MKTFKDHANKLLLVALVLIAYTLYSFHSGKLEYSSAAPEVNNSTDPKKTSITTSSKHQPNVNNDPQAGTSREHSPSTNIEPPAIKNDNPYKYTDICTFDAKGAILNCNIFTHSELPTDQNIASVNDIKRGSTSTAKDSDKHDYTNKKNTTNNNEFPLFPNIPMNPVKVNEYCPSCVPASPGVELTPEIKKTKSTATVSYSVPPDIYVNESTTIGASIILGSDKTKTIEQIKSALSSSTIKEIHSKSIKVADMVKVTLIGSPSEIDIISAGSEIQDLEYENATLWTWNVTPKRSGIIHLTLVVQSVISKKPLRMENGNDTDITVKSNFIKDIKHYLSENIKPEWLWATILVPLFPFIRKIYRKIRKWMNKK